MGYRLKLGNILFRKKNVITFLTVFEIYGLAALYEDAKHKCG